MLSPTILGCYLLGALGQPSLIGRWLDSAGFPLVFTWRGAVEAGNIPGHTQTATIYIYDLLLANRRAEARDMALIINLMALLLFIVSQSLTRRVLRG